MISDDISEYARKMREVTKTCELPSYVPPEDEVAEDSVEHPSHYTTGKIECWDYIIDQELNYCRGNAIKYISRAGKKYPEKEVEDLKKAIAYLNREIETVEDNNAQRVN
jgi:hypothetical protein